MIQSLALHLAARFRHYHNLVRLSSSSSSSSASTLHHATPSPFSSEPVHITQNCVRVCSHSQFYFFLNFFHFRIQLCFFFNAPLKPKKETKSNLGYSSLQFRDTFFCKHNWKKRLLLFYLFFMCDRYWFGHVNSALICVWQVQNWERKKNVIICCLSDIFDVSIRKGIKHAIVWMLLVELITAYSIVDSISSLNSIKLTWLLEASEKWDYDVCVGISP